MAAAQELSIASVSRKPDQFTKAKAGESAACRLSFRTRRDPEELPLKVMFMTLRPHPAPLFVKDEERLAEHAPQQAGDAPFHA
jgi:hypothetical protein